MKDFKKYLIKTKFGSFNYSLNIDNFIFYYKQIIAMLVVMLVIGGRI